MAPKRDGSARRKPLQAITANQTTTVASVGALCADLEKRRQAATAGKVSSVTSEELAQLIGALRAFPKSAADVVRPACIALRCGAEMHHRFAAQAVEAGAAEALFGCHPHDDTTNVWYTAAALASACPESLVGRFVDAGWADAALKGIPRNLDSLLLPYLATMLGRCLRAHAPCRKKLLNGGAVKTLISALSAEGDSRELPEYERREEIVSALATVVVEGRPGDAEDVVAAKGIEAVAAALQKFPQRALLQSLGCALFTNLLSSEPAAAGRRAKRLTDSGALTLAISALRAHGAVGVTSVSRTLAAEAANFAHLCVQKQPTEEAKLAALAALSAAGAVEAAAASLRAHASSLEQKPLSAGLALVTSITSDCGIGWSSMSRDRALLMARRFATACGPETQLLETVSEIISARAPSTILADLAISSLDMLFKGLEMITHDAPDGPFTLTGFARRCAAAGVPAALSAATRNVSGGARASAQGLIKRLAALGAHAPPADSGGSPPGGNGAVGARASQQAPGYLPPGTERYDGLTEKLKGLADSLKAVLGDSREAEELVAGLAGEILTVQAGGAAGQRAASSFSPEAWMQNVLERASGGGAGGAGGLSAAAGGGVTAAAGGPFGVAPAAPPPAAAPSSALKAGHAPQSCDRCGAVPGPKDPALKVCGGCRAVRFCGPACLQAAWKAGHKAECAGKKK